MTKELFSINGVIVTEDIWNITDGNFITVDYDGAIRDWYKKPHCEFYIMPNGNVCGCYANDISISLSIGKIPGYVENWKEMIFERPKKLELPN